MRRPEFVARQSAFPSGLLGRLIGHVMARETAAVNEAALELLELRPTDDVLEVGFGHGATIARLAAAVRGGRVSGVDPSPEMCAMASRRNRRAIEAGAVALRRAPAEALPFPEASFDKVLLVHTVYFWPELAPAFAEIARVLRPAGSVVLAHRTDASAARDFPAPIYRFREPAAVRAALEAAGLSCDEAILRAFGRGTICFQVARR
ncbi:MAG: class I SAM-dependent methyltransferase [Vicinamibacteria bacterium]